MGEGSFHLSLGKIFQGLRRAQICGGSLCSRTWWDGGGGQALLLDYGDIPAVEAPVTPRGCLEDPGTFVKFNGGASRMT